MCGTDAGSRTGVLALAVLAVAGCDHEPRNPRRLLEDAAAAAATAPAAEYGYRYYEFDAYGDVRIVSHGTLLLERGDAPRDWRVHQTVGRSPFMASDGTTVRRVHRDSRTVRVSPFHVAGSVLRGSADDGLVRAFVEPDPFARELAAELEWMGVADAAGVTCDVVRVAGVPGEPETWWYLDRRTHLPRQRERMRDDGHDRLEISDLTLDPDLGRDSFRLRAGDRYTEVPYELGPAPGSRVPDWELQGRDGGALSSASLAGSVVVLAFRGSRCADCPESLEAIATVREALGDEAVRFIVVETGGAGGPESPAEPAGFEVALGGDALHAELVESAPPPVYAVIGPDGALVGTGAGPLGPPAAERVERLVREGLASLVSDDPPTGQASSPPSRSTR